ncbi:protoporphyrinogen oxidase [Agromyces sp. NBRC 114283]|uniref:protoporphyrinogen oxidase n=1 Tax=Agromyces sp. NBRC 114283 TaxID=2994521 RepID=UPI0024A36DAF|nr:protoporphyrinogen oxidase [Agromyces sp. NBRC 114283]GLU87929.1 protoporphyrinogen oxidase [Agromyces sp. NBRC 114283]
MSSDPAGLDPAALDPAEAAGEPVEPEQRRSDVVVVGGGAAGLVAALECAKIGLSVTVVERQEEPGGCVGRIELEGLSLDSGAESFATRNGSVAELLEALGLADDIVTPNRAGAWLVWGAGLRAAPLPKTGVLGIPANPLGDDVRAIIGWGGAIRAYADRLMPILRIGRADSVGKLVRSRMGAAVLERLVTPISSGVYSADPMDLDLDLVAPGLNAAMTRAGSLSGGVGELVETRRAGSAVLGLRGGMHRLVDALRGELARFGAVVETGREVVELQRVESPDDEAASWRVRALGSERDLVIDARYAILAAPAQTSRRLLGQAVEGWADASDWPSAASVEIVTLVLDAPALDAAPRGTGVLVAADAVGVQAKALTHSSAKWPWLAEAANASGGSGSRHVVRLSYGRAGAANPLEGLDDEAVARLAVADASALLGVELDAEALVASGRTAWRDALSHAALGQRARVAEFEDALTAEPGIEATGSWVAGTGLASVVPHAIEAAARIRHLAVQERQ